MNNKYNLWCNSSLKVVILALLLSCNPQWVNLNITFCILCIHHFAFFLHYCLPLFYSLLLFLWTSLLFRQWCIVSLSSDKCTYCKSLWIKASAKSCKCFLPKDTRLVAPMQRASWCPSFSTASPWSLNTVTPSEDCAWLSANCWPSLTR